MAVQQSFGQQRLASLANWATKVELRGIKQETYLEVLGYVIGRQENRGQWSMKTEGKPDWDVVLTSVVLKSLSDLQFDLGASWKNSNEESGGILPAVNFLTSAVQSAGGDPERLGEDIWDACQAALALAEFGKGDVAMPMVRALNQDWEALYKRSISKTNKWSGPAYLAAVVDVIGRYESNLSDSRFDKAFSALKNLESISGKVGFFPSDRKIPEIDVWSTSLVLRTITTVPDAREKLIDRDQVQRGVLWLLQQLDSGVWKLDKAEAPMYLARALQGLRESRRWVDSHAREKIDQRLKSGNEELSFFFKDGLEPIGYLKSYTAVLEYLASSKVLAPAGLVFAASKTLRDSVVARREPIAREGGLRIVWLSDLHIGIEEPIPSLNVLKRCARYFMRYKGTPLAQHFQLRNVQTILDGVAELKPLISDGTTELKPFKPDHILISGDLTNYAQTAQFQQIHDKLIQVQAKLTGSISQALDPELWTILPGNHDVTNEEACNDPERPNLGRFFRWFGTTAFPLAKKLHGARGKLKVRLIGLDSNASSPVWRVGFNARGEIHQAQLDRLSQLLNNGEQFDITLVSLHHHPIVVPELIGQVEDYFLSLKETDGRKLVQLCANTGVGAILHGHFHRFSNWLGLVNSTRTMSIIGSAAGTLVVPDSDEEFLELRECEHEAVGGVQNGLALYKHIRKDGKWTENFTGTFLPSRLT